MELVKESVASYTTLQEFEILTLLPIKSDEKSFCLYLKVNVYRHSPLTCQEKDTGLRLVGGKRLDTTSLIIASQKSLKRTHQNKRALPRVHYSHGEAHEFGH